MEILISLVVGIVLMEIYAWLDPLAIWLVRRATKELSDDRRDEFVSQFEADLATVPNSFVKVYLVLRDCVLPIKDIEEAMLREEIAELADSFGGAIDKIGGIDKTLERTADDLSSSARRESEIVDRYNGLLERLRTLQQGQEAKAAVDYVLALSPSLTEDLSEFRAALKRYQAFLLNAATSLREPLARAEEILDRIRRRLLDEKPLDDDDDWELLDALYDSMIEVRTVFCANMEDEEEGFDLAPSDDAKSRSLAAREALLAAVRAVKEARMHRSR
jgi:hypothetical protein